MNLKDSPKWIANLLVIAFLGWLFYFGWLIAQVSFSDSDTCWLLAMGRWIIEHHELPVIDPFSADVTAYANSIHMPLIQYQWLAEVLFYKIYCSTGLMGLLFFNSIMACITFVCLPYLSLVKSNCFKFVSLIIVFALGMLATSCLFIRPQIFSFLFLSLLIYLCLPTKELVGKFSWGRILAVLLIMPVWVNTHIFFPLGIIFISLLSLVRYLEFNFMDREKKSPGLCLFILPAMAFLPTLINPWGINIWIFAAQLSTHSSSDCVTEMYPLNLFSWQDSITLSYLFLLLIYVALCVFYRAFSLKKLGLVSPLLAISGAYLGFVHIRFVPLTALFILAACAELTGRQSVFVIGKPSSKVVSFVDGIEKYLAQIFSNKFGTMSIMICIGLIGTMCGFSANPVVLPQRISSFQPPFVAIDFLKSHRPTGKVFNDPKFGSMMCWYSPNPDLFYDTRFSQYAPERMLDSIHIQNCDPGWEKSWSKYNFDWAFIRPTKPLAKALQNMGWRTVYQDDSSIILTKPNNRTGQTAIH